MAYQMSAEQLNQLLSSVGDLIINRGGLPDVQEGEVQGLREALWRAEKLTVAGPQQNGEFKFPVRGLGKVVSPQGYDGDETVEFVDVGGHTFGTGQLHHEHAGLKFIETELHNYGIEISDVPSRPTRQSAKQAANLLVNVIRDKFNQFNEGLARDEQLLFWGDGSADPKRPAGIRHFINDDPTSPLVVAGIDQSKNTWWRHAVRLGVVASPSNANELPLINAFELFWRDMLRPTGNRVKPTVLFCGADFLDQLRAEMRSRGEFTTSGWSAGGDVAIGEIRYRGIPFVHEPTLDDLGLGKRCYALRFGSDGIQIALYQGRNWRKRQVVRPHNQYVAYIAMTRYWGIVCRRRNGMGVISIA